MLDKLQEVENRYEELNKLITDPVIISDQNSFKKYMKEQSGLTEVVEKYREYKKVKQNMDEAEENLKRFKEAYPDVEVFPACTLINEGLQLALYKVADLLAVTPEFPMQEEEEQGVLYTFTPKEEPFSVINNGNGRWTLIGPKIDKLFEMTDFEKEESVRKRRKACAAGGGRTEQKRAGKHCSNPQKDRQSEEGRLGIFTNFAGLLVQKALRFEFKRLTI